MHAWRVQMENNHLLSFEEEEELQKQIISLLLQGAERPIKQKINFQKELFLLTRAFPKLQRVFDFVPHKYGPYSDSAEYVVENNVDLFAFDSRGLHLTEEGIEYSKEVLEEIDPLKKEQFTKSVRFIRDIYDKLNTDEFMFLIYSTYGFTDKSEKFEELMSNKKQLSKRLYDKNVITHQRYEELSGD
jgi:hypothetical protein